MRDELYDLIPDLALKEYRPAGLIARSGWQKFRLRTSAGYVGWTRRIWLNTDATESNSVLLTDCTIEEVHCESDTELVADYGLRSSEAVRAFAAYEMDITERPSQAEMIIQWEHSGLYFRSLYFREKQFTGEVMEISRSPVGSWQAHKMVDTIRSRMADGEGQKSKFCIYSLYRSAWAVLDALPFIAVLVLVNAMLSAVLPGILSIVGFLVSLVLIIWGYSGWSSWRHYRERLQTNSKVVAQGDEDGSVRRALGSAGILIAPASSDRVAGRELRGLQ